MVARKQQGSSSPSSERTLLGLFKRRRRTASTRSDHALDAVAVDDKYKDYPLAQSMLRFEKVRTVSLKEEGKKQIQYVQSSDGWMASIFVMRGRALDRMIWPWTIAVLHATVYTVIVEVVLKSPERDMEPWEVFFSFVLNATLSLLLVFRLNRAASRYWIARQYWGDIVARSRSLGSGLLAHGDHNPGHRDGALRWIAAFAIATMEYLRGENEFPVDNFAGILTKDQIEDLQDQGHPPLYAADRVRYHLIQLFRVDFDTPAQMAIAYSQQRDRLEEQLNEVIWSGGGMERIKATPLPIVYVSHLRTFILLHLLLMPWVFGPSWDWSTIPIVAISSFAYIGIESAAAEVECPFQKDRVNALNMDAYIIGLLSTLQQQTKNRADQDIARKANYARATSSSLNDDDDYSRIAL